MSEFILENPSFVNEEVLASYVDVYLHCENNSIVEGNMATIAQQSPFFHKFFQSRRGMKVADMFFTHIRQSVVRSAMDIMYGKSVNVTLSDVKRVSSFLNLLGVKYKVSSTVNDASLENTNYPANIKVQAQAAPKETEEDQIKEIETRKNALISIHREKEVDTMSVQSIEPRPGTSQTKQKMDWDNWTVTTTDSEGFANIRQTVVRDNGRKIYKCQICSVFSLDFSAAEKHYQSKHRNLTTELNLLKRVLTQRALLKAKFQELSSRGKNNVLIEHECSEILETFQNFETELNILPADLPSHMETKKKRTIKEIER